MTALTSYDTDRRARLSAASSLFDSIGEVLLCADGEFRICWAPSEMRELVGSPVEAVLGPEVDELLRMGRRSDTRATVRTSRATRGANVTLAPCVSHGEFGSDVRYVIVLRSLDDGNDTCGEIVAALQANRWRRDATAKSLGISRATLWRKMRDLGLL